MCQWQSWCLWEQNCCQAGAWVVGPLPGKQASNYGVAICGSNSSRWRCRHCDEDKQQLALQSVAWPHGQRRYPSQLCCSCCLGLFVQTLTAVCCCLLGLQRAGLHLSVVGEAWVYCPHCKQTEKWTDWVKYLGSRLGESQITLKRKIFSTLRMGNITRQSSRTLCTATKRGLKMEI